MDPQKASLSSHLPQVPNMSKLKKFYRHAEVIEHPESDIIEKLKPEESVTYNNLSKTHGPYWGVALDGRPIKTIYKERMAVPSRALAVALAEEWESQGEKIDIKSLHLNQMLAKAIRAENDPSLAQYYQDQIQVTLENDQVCFREDPDSQNDYKRNLAMIQKKHTDPVFEFMKRRFDITLKIWHAIPLELQDKSVKNISPVLAELDPMVLNSLYQITTMSKSAALAFTLLYQGDREDGEGIEKLSLHEAVNISRVDEQYQ